MANLDYAYLINRYTDLGDVVADLDCFRKPKCLATAIELGRATFGFCSDSVTLGAAEEILKNVTCTVRKASLRSGKSLQPAAAATKVPRACNLKDPLEDNNATKFSSKLHVLEITEDDFFKRVNCSKLHAPLLFDDTETYSEREKVYADKLQEECDLDELTVALSTLEGTGRGLFTNEDITEGKRYGYKGTYVRSSKAHELTTFYKNELLSMKCNTENLDINDEAAVKEYFEKDYYFYVSTWEFNGEQEDAINEVFRRVAAEKCLGHKLVAHVLDAEQLPVSSFLNLAKNEVDFAVFEVLCTLFCKHSYVDNFILVSPGTYDELFGKAPKTIPTEQLQALPENNCLFWVLNSGTAESPKYFFVNIYKKAKRIETYNYSEDSREMLSNVTSWWTSVVSDGSDYEAVYTEPTDLTNVQMCCFLFELVTDQYSKIPRFDKCSGHKVASILYVYLLNEGLKLAESIEHRYISTHVAFKDFPNDEVLIWGSFACPAAFANHNPATANVRICINNDFWEAIEAGTDLPEYAGYIEAIVDKIPKHNELMTDYGNSFWSDTRIKDVTADTDASIEESNLPNRKRKKVVPFEEGVTAAAATTDRKRKRLKKKRTTTTTAAATTDATDATNATTAAAATTDPTTAAAVAPTDAATHASATSTAAAASTTAATVAPTDAATTSAAATTTAAAAEATATTTASANATTAKKKKQTKSSVAPTSAAGTTAAAAAPTDASIAATSASAAATTTATEATAPSAATAAATTDAAATTSAAAAAASTDAADATAPYAATAAATTTSAAAAAATTDTAPDATAATTTAATTTAAATTAARGGTDARSKKKKKTTPVAPTATTTTSATTDAQSILGNPNFPEKEMIRLGALCSELKDSVNMTNIDVILSVVDFESI